MSDPILIIDGIDRTSKYKVNTCRISKQLNGRATADLVLHVRGLEYMPALGNPIAIAKDGVTRFAGHISELRSKVHPGTNLKEISVRALDYTHILDRRLVSATFENRTLYAIVKSIIDNYFSEEGITYNHVENPGPTITQKLVLNYMTGTAAFQQLAQITGYQFYIDAEKDLHFSAFASNAAPFGLTDDSENWSDLEVRTSLSGYRNRQYVRTEHQITVMRTETFTADGVETMFKAKYPFASKPTLLVNGVATDLGVMGKAEDLHLYDWYGTWPAGSFVYKVDPVTMNVLAPDAGTEIEIRYQALFDNVVMVEDTAEQAARAAAEGGSGIWEAMREERNLDTIDALEAVGQGELRRNGKAPKKISFRTDEDGLEPGQMIHIQNTLHNINDDFLIESVDYEWIAALRGDFFRCSVKCSDSEPDTTGTGSGVAAMASYLGRVSEVARIGPSNAGGSISTGEGADIAIRFVFEFPDSAPISIGSNLSINPYQVRLKAGRKIKLDSAVVTTNETVDGDIVFDLFVSTDGGATRTSIFNSNYPTVEDGTKTGTPVTSFAVPYLNIDDLVELDVKAIGNNTVVSGALVLSGTVVAA